MSKHSRNKLAKRLKELGYGKLYIGSKSQARRYYTSRTCEYLLSWLDLKVGDVVNDCDLFNYEISKLPPLYRRSPPFRAVPTGKTLVWDCDSQCFFTSGGASCGCSVPEPALSAEKVRERHRGFWEYAEAKEETAWWLPKEPDSVYQRWKKDKSYPICDDRGMKLK